MGDKEVSVHTKTGPFDLTKCKQVVVPTEIVAFQLINDGNAIILVTSPGRIEGMPVPPGGLIQMSDSENVNVEKLFHLWWSEKQGRTDDAVGVGEERITHNEPGQVKSPWLTLEEKPPLPLVPILVWDGDRQQVAIMDCGDFFSDPSGELVSAVTHWLPLPGDP